MSRILESWQNSERWDAAGPWWGGDVAGSGWNGEPQVIVVLAFPSSSWLFQVLWENFRSPGLIIFVLTPNLTGFFTQKRVWSRLVFFSVISNISNLASFSNPCPSSSHLLSFKIKPWCMSSAGKRVSGILHLSPSLSNHYPVMDFSWQLPLEVRTILGETQAWRN